MVQAAGASAAHLGAEANIRPDSIGAQDPAVEQRSLLFISGGVEALPAIHQARAMGLRVVVSDADDRAPGCLAADHVLLASTYDIEATVAAAREFVTSTGPLHGVICVAADVPVTTAAVASSLQLPTISVDSAQLAADKLAMKERFRRDGIAIPTFAAVASVDELAEQVAAHGACVVKPVDSRGARGVLKVQAHADLAGAFAEAQRHSPSGRVMVEQFLEGPQISTESLVLDGRTHTPGFADRNYEFLERFAPHIIENGADLPSAVTAAEREMVCDLVDRAAASLGIRNGVVKGDIVISDGRAYVIELAARLSGGYLCTHMIPLSTGVDFVGCAIRLALGERVDPAELVPKFQRGVAQRWLFPAPGRVVGVHGVQEAAEMPGVSAVDIRLAPGDVVEPMQSHVSRGGMVLAIGESREMAVDRAHRAIARIEVEAEPV